MNHAEGWYILLTRSLMGHAGAQPTYNLTQGDLEPVLLGLQACVGSTVHTRHAPQLPPCHTSY